MFIAIVTACHLSACVVAIEPERRDTIAECQRAHGFLTLQAVGGLGNKAATITRECRVVKEPGQ